VKKQRDNSGLNNITILIPYQRIVTEAHTLQTFRWIALHEAT